MFYKSKSKEQVIHTVANKINLPLNEWLPG